MSTLTPKQEKFSLRYGECGNASDAYRQAYETSKMKSETIWKRAGEVLANGVVAGRVAELRREAHQRTMVSASSLTSELEVCRQKALETGNFSTAVAATMGKAKLHGLLVKKHEVNLNVNLAERMQMARKRVSTKRRG